MTQKVNVLLWLLCIKFQEKRRDTRRKDNLKEQHIKQTPDIHNNTFYNNFSFQHSSSDKHKKTFFESFMLENCAHLMFVSFEGETLLSL